MVNAKRLSNVMAGLFIGLVTLFMAFPFERISGSISGHALGMVGTILMFSTLIYPFRKRILKKKGKQNPLLPHIYFGLVGSSLVVIHSGHKHANTIGVLIFIAMLLVVLSGIIGKMLYAKVALSLRGHQADLKMLTQAFRERKKTNGISFEVCRLVFERENLSAWRGKNEHDTSGPESTDFQARCFSLLEIAEAMAEKERAIQVFLKTQKYFSFWSNMHFFSTYFLFAMIGLHVLTTVYYGLRWLP